MLWECHTQQVEFTKLLLFLCLYIFFLILFNVLGMSSSPGRVYQAVNFFLFTYFSISFQCCRRHWPASLTSLYRTIDWHSPLHQQYILQYLHPTTVYPHPVRVTPHTPPQSTGSTLFVFNCQCSVRRLHPSALHSTPCKLLPRDSTHIHN